MKDTILFRLAINVDRLFNILTGGELGVCFSTRTYINSVKAEEKSRVRWERTRKVIDKCLGEGHCESSYDWERHIKEKWLVLNRVK